MASTAFMRSPVKARYVPTKPGARANRYDTPTSGKNPMPTSGIATDERSVTTRCAACAEMPTPPPITTPSITATIGFG